MKDFENTKIKEIFLKYKINNILKLEDKYLDCLISRMTYEYKVFDKGSFSTSRFSSQNNFFKKSLIIIGGAIISLIKTIKYRKKVKIHSNIIGIPFAGHIVRFKRIQEISDENIDIIYTPLFHFEHIKKHLSTFDEQGKNVFLGSFTLPSIAKSFWAILSNIKSLKKCSEEIDSFFESYTCKLPGIIILTILYRQFILNLIDKNCPDYLKEEQIIWLFDYDFDLKYIIFNETIHRKRPNDITMHIQHGSFTRYEDSYCNPISDYSLCCSLREADIIKHYNKYKSRIVPLGAPLQTFIDEQTETSKEPTYDILVLLTSTYDSYFKNKQIEFLKNLNYSKYSHLIRFRPASRSHDEPILKQYIGNAEISKRSTLQEDINKSKIIISFSEDALYTAFRNNKRIVVITKDNPEDSYNYDKKTPNLIIVNNYDEIQEQQLDSLISGYTSCSYDNDEFVLYNFGANELTSLHSYFMKILHSIKK